MSADSVLSRHARGREDLIPILQDLQVEEGYLSQDAVRQVSRRLRVSESEIYGVATFYAQFRFTPPGDHHIHVCTGTACHVRGGAQVLDALRRRLGVEEGETTADGRYDLNRVACLGCCALAPVVKIDDRVHAQMSVLGLGKVMDEHDRAR